MRKIKTQEEIEKKQKRMKMIIGIVFIFLMTFSTAGFALFGRSGNSKSDSETAQQDSYYNGQYWIYNLNGREFYFTNSKEQTKDVSVEISATFNNYVGSNVYIDSDSDAITNELGNNIGRFAGRFQKACYGSCEEDLPEKDCNDNLIVWKESEERKVYQEGNCIFINGDLVTVDAFLYKMLGFS